ncbi:hypothetical protein BDR04DRAFT_1120726 [Suillus decipiens]|nr:hypothetical protein BDR04DRAFT_1120726 [Suillus decipiens]
MEVDQLSDKAGISQESQIKYAVRYADPNKADLWKDLDKYTECGPMHYVSAKPADPESPEICELAIQDKPATIIVEEAVYDIPRPNPVECTIIEDKPILAADTAIPEILDPWGKEIFEATCI